MCATTGTQYWMYNTLSTPAQPWRSWQYDSSEYGRQIAGYFVGWAGLALATVHSSGHMVPNYQPTKALMVLVNFLNRNFTAPEPQSIVDLAALL